MSTTTRWSFSLYSYDLTWVTPRMPDYVVTPESVEEIQRILRFANREEIPVIPYVSGANIGGLTIPEEGDIILDLKRLNRITKIGTETHYAIIEPGVTHAQFSAILHLGTSTRKPLRPPNNFFWSRSGSLENGQFLSRHAFSNEGAGPAELVTTPSALDVCERQALVETLKTSANSKNRQAEGLGASALSDLSDKEALVRLKAVAVRRGLWFKVLGVFAES